MDAKAPGWGQIFGANPRGAWGMVMDEIYTCIIPEIDFGISSPLLKSLVTKKHDSLK